MPEDRFEQCWRDYLAAMAIDGIELDEEKLAAIRHDFKFVWDRAEESLKGELERLRDLVRQQRAELHDANLISDEEYAALAMTVGATARLYGYDELRANLDNAFARIAKLEEELDRTYRALRREQG